MISKTKLDDRGSCIMVSDTSSVGTVGDPGDPESDQKVGVRKRRGGRRQVIRSYPGKAYLMYHAVSMEAMDYFMSSFLARIASIREMRSRRGKKTRLIKDSRAGASRGKVG